MSKQAKRARWKQRVYKQNVAHSFNRKVLNWVYCSGCGLLALNNEVTRRAMNKPCPSMEE